MKNFFKIFAACFVALIIHSVVSVFIWIAVFAGFISSFSTSETFSVQSKSILVIDLSINMPDNPSQNPVDNFNYSTLKVNKTVSLFEAVSLIEKAGSDPCIEGIYLNINSAPSLSSSALYELREAITKFRKVSKKFVIAHADSYSQGGYYLATSADKVYLNPQGSMDWSGLSSQVMFYRGLFDKIGIEPEIIRHGKFKGAVEPFMLTKMSDENRLQMQSLLNSMWGFMVSEIGASRSISVDSLQQYATQMTIINPQVAMEKGLVDSLYYTDQLFAKFTKLTNENELRFVTLTQYKTANPTSTSGTLTAKDQIAVVYAEGSIVDAGAGSDIVGNALAEELRKVRKDNKIKAVVLRVNSPGGSVLASDIIWREVSLLKAAKPVIISMGTYAASGGYYISAPADEIVTTPMTLTGSIGVFGMMFNVEKAAREKLGLNVEVVKTNAMADAGNMFRAITPAERTLMQNGVDSIYTRFVGLVAKGRNLPFGEVDDMAQGRVWSGLQAIDNKLADKIGTLSDAIASAAKKAGIQEYRIKTYPESDDSLMGMLQSMSQMTVKLLSIKTGLEAIPTTATEIEQTVEKYQGIWAKIPYYDINIR